MNEHQPHEPAFPLAFQELDQGGMPRMGMYANDGMSLREYAAIKLRVPKSDCRWLDEMIRESLRNELAAKAMQGLITGGDTNAAMVAQAAHIVADAMLKAREA